MPGAVSGSHQGRISSSGAGKSSAAVHLFPVFSPAGKSPGPPVPASAASPVRLAKRPLPPHPAAVPAPDRWPLPHSPVPAGLSRIPSTAAERYKHPPLPAGPGCPPPEQLPSGGPDRPEPGPDCQPASLPAIFAVPPHPTPAGSGAPPGPPEQWAGHATPPAEQCAPASDCQSAGGGASGPPCGRSQPGVPGNVPAPPHPAAYKPVSRCRAAAWYSAPLCPPVMPQGHEGYAPTHRNSGVGSAGPTPPSAGSPARTHPEHPGTPAAPPPLPGRSGALSVPPGSAPERFVPAVQRSGECPPPCGAQWKIPGPPQTAAPASYAGHPPGTAVPALRRTAGSPPPDPPSRRRDPGRSPADPWPWH